MIRSPLFSVVCRARLVPRQTLLAHTQTCPTQNQKCKTSVTPDASASILKRRIHPAKVRYGFVPEEWFTFFHCKTGVTGPYVFFIMVSNYLFSKEIYVMEHEFSVGLSLLLMIYYVTTRFGKDVAKWLDKGVDEYDHMFNKSRSDELHYYEAIIESSKVAQWRAEGQKLLMDAKKENITMQLEAVYRERMMVVYRRVKSSLDYHARLHQVHREIETKWMIEWIIESVKKSITPDFQKLALERAIQEISVMGDKTKH